MPSPESPPPTESLPPPPAPVESPPLESVDFEHLRMSKSPFRDQSRGKCPKCARACWAFCAVCGALADHVSPSAVPALELPFRVTVVRHKLENRKKSTAIPAALLSRDIRLITWNHEEDKELEALDRRGDDVVLLFPDDAAVPVETVEWSKVSEVLLIDSTWTQAKTIRKQTLPHVKTCKLGAFATNFWRYNDVSGYRGDECLSTVEALYFFLRSAAPDTPHLDDVLFFYEAQWFRIKSAKGTENTLALGKTSRARRDVLKTQQPNKRARRPAPEEFLNETNHER